MGTAKLASKRWAKFCLVVSIATATVLAGALLQGCQFTDGLKKTPGAQFVGGGGSGGGGGGGGGGGIDPSVDLAAFQSTVYPHLRASDPNTTCSRCHAAGGQESGIPFGGSNPTAAMAEAKKWVNFATINQSDLVSFAQNGHCSLAMCTGQGTAMTNWLNQWVAARSASVNNSQPLTLASFFNTGIGLQDTIKYLTQQLPIPASLSVAQSVDSTFAPVQFPLSNLWPADPDLASAVFEVEVQRYINASGDLAYRIRRPKIASPTFMVYVKNVQILINGRYDGPTRAFTDVDTTIAPQALPAEITGPLSAPLLSTSTVTAPQDKVSGDQISIGFEDLHKVTIDANSSDQQQ